MIFDTDVLIWFLRGSERAAESIEQNTTRAIAVVTYMELLQGARDKRELRALRDMLTDFGFVTLPLTENIGHRASIYVEEYALSDSVSMPDALVAATAVESNKPLLSGNERHFKPIAELKLHRFAA